MHPVYRRYKGKRHEGSAHTFCQPNAIYLSQLVHIFCDHSTPNNRRLSDKFYCKAMSFRPILPPFLVPTYSLHLLLSKSLKLLASIHRTIFKATGIKWACRYAHWRDPLPRSSAGQRLRFATSRCTPLSLNLQEIMMEIIRVCQT